MEDKLEEQILSKLRKCLTNLLEHPEKEITLNTVLESDLGMDGFDKYEFAYRVEGKFKIKIPDEKIQDGLKTVKDYSDYILSKKTS